MVCYGKIEVISLILLTYGLFWLVPVAFYMKAEVLIRGLRVMILMNEEALSKI